jgi:hypothetical protein
LTDICQGKNDNLFFFSKNFLANIFHQEKISFVLIVPSGAGRDIGLLEGGVMVLQGG